MCFVQCRNNILPIYDYKATGWAWLYYSKIEKKMWSKIFSRVLAMFQFITATENDSNTFGMCYLIHKRTNSTTTVITHTSLKWRFCVQNNLIFLSIWRQAAILEMVPNVHYNRWIRVQKQQKCGKKIRKNIITTYYFLIFSAQNRH